MATARLDKGMSRYGSPFFVFSPFTPRKRAVCLLRSTSCQTRDSISDCRAAVSIANSTAARGNWLAQSLSDIFSLSHSSGSRRLSRALLTVGLRTSAVGIPWGRAMPQSMAHALKIRDSILISWTTVCGATTLRRASRKSDSAPRTNVRIARGRTVL